MSPRSAALSLLSALVLATGAGCPQTGSNVHIQPGALPDSHPALPLPPVSRSPRRLDVDQLLASVRVIASDDGSITWNQDRATTERTLGKPDFAQITNEDLSPSTLYLKFMDDLAHDVCNKMVAAPAASQVLMRYAGKTDTLSSNPDAVQKNLRYLYLRFFGRKIPDGDTTTLAPLQTVFQSVSAAEATDKKLPSSSSPATEGWRAVCYAAFTSPDLHLY